MEIVGRARHIAQEFAVWRKTCTPALASIVLIRSTLGADRHVAMLIGGLN